MFKLMGKKTIKILRKENFLIWTYDRQTINVSELFFIAGFYVVRYFHRFRARLVLLGMETSFILLTPQSQVTGQVTDQVICLPFVIHLIPKAVTGKVTGSISQMMLL